MPGSRISWIIHGIAAMLLVGWHHSVLKQHINQMLQTGSFKILISNRWRSCCSGLDIQCWIMAVVRQRHDECQLFLFRIIFLTVRFLSLCRVEMTSAADVMTLCMTLEMTSLCIIHRHLASVTEANAIVITLVSLHCGIDFSTSRRHWLFLQKLWTNVFVMIIYYV